MSFLLSCPHCGPRDVDEFAYAGEVTSRPTASPTLRELTDYVYFRRNVAGLQREWWQHRYGCEVWVLAERDTRTNEVRGVELPAPPPDPAARCACRRSPPSGSTAPASSVSASAASPCARTRATRSARHSSPPVVACSRAASSTTGRAAFSAARAAVRTA